MPFMRVHHLSWYGTHCVLDPSDGVFGRFDLAALGGCHTLNVCYVMLSSDIVTDQNTTRSCAITFRISYPA